MTSTTSNNTIINNEVSNEFPQKLKEPETTTSMSIKMNKNDNKSQMPLFSKFITEQFHKVVPCDEDELEAFIEEHFNNYNDDIRTMINAKEQYSKEETQHFNNVIDEAVDEFGYDLIKGKDFTERMELFVYLEAKEQGRKLIAIKELKQSGATAEEIRNHIIKLIVDKHRGCDAVFRDLFAIPAAKHSPATFYVSGEGFENGEVSDDMDALFGITDTDHKETATCIVKLAIAEHHARFGKSQHDNYLFLEVEREEMFRQLAIRDKEILQLKHIHDVPSAELDEALKASLAQREEIDGVVRKRVEDDKKEIADLKKKLKHYEDNYYNEEQMDEKLEEKEQEVLEGLYCGGEFDEKYCELIDEGKSEVYDNLGNWLKLHREELGNC